VCAVDSFVNCLYFMFGFVLFDSVLQVRFRDICKVIYDTKVGMADQSATAFFSLTEAEYAAGNFRSKVLEGNLTATVRVTSRTDNVAGVKLPVFGQYDTGAINNDNLGLMGGGRKIAQCKDKFSEYLKALVKIASLQTSFLAMDEALKITNRRVNALENVTLPKIIRTIDYINRYRFAFLSVDVDVLMYYRCRELDELEREDFTRLKMVKKKKEEQIKLEEKEKQAGLAAANANVISEEQKEVTEQVSKLSVAPTAATPVGNAHTHAHAHQHAAEVETGKSSKKNKKNKKKEVAQQAVTGNVADGDDDDDVVF
jgi:V-type H+-transporting ATPase subunit D